MIRQTLELRISEIWGIGWVVAAVSMSDIRYSLSIELQLQLLLTMKVEQDNSCALYIQ